MKEFLNISVCQPDLIWEAPDVNMDRLGKFIFRHISACADGQRPDLLVLPEFFTTGFTSDRRFAEPVGGPALEWMKSVASAAGVAVTGSVPVEEGGNLFNRMYFVRPDGSCEHYDKRHLFRLSPEPEVFTSGNRRRTVDFCGWKIALNICYDLRFPVWSRNSGDMYDIMVNVASWPSSRIETASLLARARAVENLAYFVFCNRTGVSPEGNYSGGSVVYDYKGRSAGTFVAYGDMGDGGGFLDASLEAASLVHFRKKFPVWMDADKFDIIHV